MSASLSQWKTREDGSNYGTALWKIKTKMPQVAPLVAVLLCPSYWTRTRSQEGLVVVILNERVLTEVGQTSATPHHHTPKCRSCHQGLLHNPPTQPSRKATAKRWGVHECNGCRATAKSPCANPCFQMALSLVPGQKTRSNTCAYTNSSHTWKRMNGNLPMHSSFSFGFKVNPITVAATANNLAATLCFSVLPIKCSTISKVITHPLNNISKRQTISPTTSKDKHIPRCHNTLTSMEVWRRSCSHWRKKTFSAGF